MEPTAIAHSYDQLADHWNSDDFDRNNGIEQHEKAVAFAHRKSTALDVGCGSSGRIIDLLLHHGYEVEGLDLSKRMLALAAARHPDVVFHHADICDWVPPDRYDFISAWDSVWHVPLKLQEAVTRKLLRALTPGGVLIFTTGGVEAASEVSDKAMGVPMYTSALGISRISEILAEEQCVCRHLEYDQYPEVHVYIIAQKPR